ncbi:hypothetical protein EF847_12335 [Actinobacteria bacterium YIM 96077]|uniref:Uncharacterized protein n=1 Tax=Phytoactinopolyspora halophila TaxID=1981511 RepID=A0A329R1P1_9ACTN|nr:UbiA family prenyltransferase [Phytoactinopolyspora halophila]AYY13363.1 hypothetical protein EF847_12335 [Actinobacteria bacterium YIM 96077]RAW17402.1 hypothetical protein DPM12_05100 [Phytoactinopolyspora halophila]
MAVRNPPRPRRIAVPAWLETITCRWEITIVIVAQAVALYMFGELASGGAPDSFRILVAGLFGLCAQGLCSVLNDIADVDADRVNHPERPFPSGRVSIRQGWFVVVACFLGALLCGAILAYSVLGYIMLGLHLALSVAYSCPGVRLGRHWLLGPLTLVSATVCGIWFILSCTPLAPGVVVLISSVCFLHHLLVIPLKDIKDVAGDALVGGTSLAMKFPRRAVHATGITGYLVPWLILFVAVDAVGSSAIEPPLRAVAVLFGIAGATMACAVLFRPELLRTSQRFCWFAELGLLFLFQLSLPFAVVVFA